MATASLITPFHSLGRESKYSINVNPLLKTRTQVHYQSIRKNKTFLIKQRPETNNIRVQCFMNSNKGFEVKEEEKERKGNSLDEIIEVILKTLNLFIQKTAIAGVILGLLMTYNPHLALAASGGRMGGRSFSSSSSGGSSSSSSSSGSSSKSSSSRSSSSSSPSSSRSSSSSSPSSSSHKSSSSSRPSYSSRSSSRPSYSSRSSSSSSSRSSSSSSSPSNSSGNSSSNNSSSSSSSPSYSTSSSSPSPTYVSASSTSSSWPSYSSESSSKPKSSPSPNYSSPRPSTTENEPKTSPEASKSSSGEDEQKKASEARRSSPSEEEHCKTAPGAQWSTTLKVLKALGIIVIIAGVIYFVAEMRDSEEKTQPRQSSSYEQRQPRTSRQSSVDPLNAATVFMIQVALLGATRSLQKDLDKIAEVADTSTTSGLSYILQESTVALIRHLAYCFSSFSSVDVKQDKVDGEKLFNKLTIEERAKFDEETLVNVDNVKKQSTPSKKPNGLSSDYLVMTILVAAMGDLKLGVINNSDDLQRALTKLGAIPTSKILAVEVMWTPQEENDTLSERELLEDYPRLRPL